MAFNTMSESLKSREKALKESELKYRTIFEHTSDGISVYEQFSGNRRLVDCNESYAGMADRSKSELLSMKDVKQFQRNHRTTENGSDGQKDLEEALSCAGTFSWIRPDSRENHIEYRAVTVKMEERIFVYGIDRDITARKQAEEQVHALTQKLIMAQETERQRISRDLHDNVAQDLSTIKIACETLLDNQPEAPDLLRQNVSKLSDMLQGAISVVRDLSYNLRPPGLDQLGLVQTVFQYCEDFSDKNGINVDFYSAGLDDPELEFDTEINLFRIIQEALNNVKRHADAGYVAIRLVASYPDIILRIEDDGKGFDVKERMITALSEKRMGLRSIDERVNLLRGRIRIQSRPMKGTQILIEVPCREEKYDAEEKSNYC